MLKRKIIYLLLFIFFTWLAIATRTHAVWFHPFVQEYGGDTIWAGMFLFFLRIFWGKANLLKLALICYLIGVSVELLQLYHAPWIEAIRQTRIGGLILGFGFLWSDIVCYAVGIVIAYCMVVLIERAVK